jgi:hypothetical protein
VATLRIYFEDEQMGAKFSRGTLRRKEVVLSAIRGAAKDAADEMKTRADQDIHSAGKFGSRWETEAKVTEGGGNIRVELLEPVPYWHVFQFGAVIRGKPLLWIPLSFASDAQGIRARDFPGKLFRVDRKAGGAPLLLSASDKQPKYSGHESVTIPKKFHLIEIGRDVAKKIRDFYNARLKAS